MKPKNSNEFLILGILNVTPDSFSDGGRFNHPEVAVRRFHQLLADGADQVDIGAESTRPGAEPLESEMEWQRLRAVLTTVAESGGIDRVSLDTRHDQTALSASGLGVRRFNNVAGVYRSETLQALHGAGGKQFIAMHMQGTPKTMQANPIKGGNAVDLVAQSFAEYERKLTLAGWRSSELFMDPGIGFGKDDHGNLRLIESVPAFAKNFQVAMGISRKGFLGRLLNLEPEVSRDPPTKALEMALIMMGARLIRTHDVTGLERIRKMMRGAKQ